ncbi:putative membrane protein [Halapricum desulfuricans]|uniref:Putative membrane protein n=1 Tax=Halapricum desulfuricans TaxID=2841257 RepID=A0A897NLS5_9EURY|nr:hypothetical protein [Halapricum desulfuricans]QSG13231.1 putative membrane protein [Halapricum desulfuricans]
MQRRAAAVYFVLFAVVSAGAYTYVGMAERPQVDLSGETYAEGETLTVGDRTYTVASVGDSSGELTWTDPDATYTATLQNDSTVSWQVVSWDGQRVDRVTVPNGSTVTFGDRDHRLLLNASTDPPTLRLEAVENSSINTTFERGETLSFEYDDQYVPDGTITNVTSDEATASWGSAYLVSIPNETDPATASLIQQQNVTRLLLTDDAVEDSLGTAPDGTRYVQYRNGTQQPLAAYLPEPETRTLAEGETLTYEGNETTVGNITRSTLPLNRTGPRTIGVGLSAGQSVNLDGQSYFVHIPDSGTVQLAPNTTETREAYRDSQAQIDVYQERKAGLWGVTILSSFAAVLLLGLAYLPNKD